MDKIRIKKELEEMILSVMINEPESVPFISQRIKTDDVTSDNNSLFEKILSLDIKDSAMRILELAKENIQGWNIKSLDELSSKYLSSSLEGLIKNNVFEKFYDINFSLSVDSFLKKCLNKNKDEINGLYTLSELQDEIEHLRKKTENFKDDKMFSDKIIDIYNEIDNELSSKEVNSFTVKNIPSFNSSTSGIRPSNLIGIAGSFKSGKTTLGLNLILDFAKQKIPCGIFSLELSETEINRKILGMLAGIEYEKLREPKKLSQDEINKLSRFQKKIEKLPLYITDRPMNEMDIKQKAKYWKDRFGIKIICIDYIGYIKSRRKFETREREMSYYSEFLKALAKELNISIIALAQLNRTGKLKPSTENLAESIALARDCDFLFITYNPFELGIKSSSGIQLNESHFFVKLDTTRHTKHKRQFLLSLKNDGNFIEIATEYENKYQGEIPPELLKHLEPEEIF